MGLPADVNATIKMSWNECCACGMLFGLTNTYEKRRREDHEFFYCPAGHPQHFPHKSEAEKLRAELAEKQRVLDRAREWSADLIRQRDGYKRSARTYRGHMTRIRKRVGNGVCPCCTRSFTNLKRHMQAKHPGFAQPIE